MFAITHISVILFITTLINAITALIAWQKKETKGGLYIALAMTALTFWTLAAALDYSAIPVSLKIFFSKLEYLCYNSALWLMAIFALQYSGYEHWLRKPWFKLALILAPVSNITLAWTNELHHLLWTGFTPSPAGNNVVVFQHGPAFVWAVAAGYFLVMVILTSLWQAARNGSQLNRRQAGLLLGAVLVPVFSNLLYLLNIEGLAGIDWSSITFSISGMFFFGAIYAQRFLDVVPVARHTMIDRMPEGILVLDAHGRLVDFNSCAQTLFELNQIHLGRPIQAVVPRWPEIIELASGPSPNAAPVTIIPTSGSVIYDATITFLQDDHRHSEGKLIVLRDITDRYRAELALSERIEDLKNLQEQLVIQQRELAKADERRRMARDLHDSVNQSIHSLVLFADTLAALIEKGNLARAGQVLERLQESARQSLKETRLLLYQLQEDGVKGSDLPHRLETRLATVERRAGVRVRFLQEGVADGYPPEWSNDLYWIAIEALNNSLKHAQANSVQVLLRCIPPRLELRISDNGRGFDPASIGYGGQGLKNMQERAALIGGMIKIESDPGQGTSVSLVAEMRSQHGPY